MFIAATLAANRNFPPEYFPGISSLCKLSRWRNLSAWEWAVLSMEHPSLLNLGLNFSCTGSVFSSGSSAKSRLSELPLKSQESPSPVFFLFWVSWTTVLHGPSRKFSDYDFVSFSQWIKVAQHMLKCFTEIEQKSVVWGVRKSVKNFPRRHCERKKTKKK